MLVKVKFSNFYSFAEQAQISFEIGKQPKRTKYDINFKNEDRLNKIALIIGANGAGKTHFLKVLPFLSWFIGSSFLEGSPDPKVLMPVATHKFHQNSPICFEVEFIIDDEKFKYNLEIQNNIVTTESMQKKSLDCGKYSYLFKRIYKDGNYEFKQKGFEFPIVQATNVRTTASIIAAGNSFGVEGALKFIKYFQKFKHNLTNARGRISYADGNLINVASYFYQHPNLQENAKELLCNFDLGLSDIVIQEQVVQDVNRNGSIHEASESWYIPIGVHTIGDKSFTLPFFEESNGTKSAYTLLSHVLPVLQNGGVAIIDELDNDLHPDLLDKVLDLFVQKESNPHQAQLIFSSHNHRVLDKLQKHQVYLVEKSNLHSESWRLDQMSGLRADDNLRVKYLTGALGAVPDISF